MNAGYDSFEDSRAVVERLFAIPDGELTVSPDEEEWRRLRREAETLFADDAELVTRDGTLYGPQRVFDDLETQLRRFTLDLRLRDVFPGDDGRVVVIMKLMRRSREDSDDHFWNLGGAVYGVRGGRIVFFEGYPNARRACQDLGVDPDLAR